MIKAVVDKTDLYERRQEMEITLKAARVNKGLTQSEAAKELGTSSRTIYLWEKGKCFPNALQINKIEKLYGVSYNEIIFLPQDVE